MGFVCIAPPFQGEGLVNANLEDAEMQGSDLSNADLSGADLSGADLSYASKCNPLFNIINNIFYQS